MFEGLSSLKPPVSARLTPEQLAWQRVHRAAVQIGIQNVKARASLLAAMTNAQTVTAEFADVRRLRHTIRAEGLTRSLLAFVSHGLPRAAPGLPSTETLDAVPVGRSDPRAKEALEAIDQLLDTEPEAVADHIRTGADSIGVILDVTERQLKDYGMAVSHYLVSLEGCDAPEVAEGLAESTLEALPADCARSCIDALLDVLPELDAVVSDPTDRDATDAHQAKMAKVVERIGAHAGLTADPDNPHQLSLCDRSDAMSPVSDTFAAHGYTLETVIALLKRADVLLDTVHGLIDRKEEVLDRLQGAATMVVAIDNDVPPAVDGAIVIDVDDDDDEPAEEGGVLTQADVIQCHATAHMSCIAAVTETTVMVVQNVLAVAEHVDQFVQGRCPSE
jgi:hypothetical protein